MATDDDVEGTSIAGLVGAFVPPAGRIDHARRLRRRLHGPRPATPPCRAATAGGRAGGTEPAGGAPPSVRVPSVPLAGLAGAVRSPRLRGRARRTVARWGALAACTAGEAGPGRPADLPATVVALVPVVLVGALLALALAGVVLLDAAGRALLALGRPVRLLLRPPAVHHADPSRPAPTVPTRPA